MLAIAIDVPQKKKCLANCRCPLVKVVCKALVNVRSKEVVVLAQLRPLWRLAKYQDGTVTRTPKRPRSPFESQLRIDNNERVGTSVV